MGQVSSVAALQNALKLNNRLAKMQPSYSALNWGVSSAAGLSMIAARMKFINVTGIGYLNYS